VLVLDCRLALRPGALMAEVVYEDDIEGLWYWRRTSRRFASYHPQER